MYRIYLVKRCSYVRTYTINHLCKMIAVTIQGRLQFEGGIYYNVMIIAATATIQKTR